MKRLYTVVILTTILTASILSQGFPPPGKGGDSSRIKLRQRIETIRMWKLLERLDLSQEQSIQFLPLYQDFEETNRQIDEENLILFEDLREQMNSEKIDEVEIEETLELSLIHI